MAYVFVLLGALGFLAGYAADLGVRKEPQWAARFLWSLSFALLLASLVLVCVDSPRFALPTGAVLTGWVLSPLVFSLLLYSLFIELPWRKTYGGTVGSPPLVTTGTYALVRHPTVLWYVLLLFSLLLASQSWLLLAAMPVWISFDVMWAVLQERIVLPPAHPTYRAYRQDTPFLMPTISSIQRCVRGLLNVRTLKVPKEATHVSGN